MKLPVLAGQSVIQKWKSEMQRSSLAIGSLVEFRAIRRVVVGCIARGSDMQVFLGHSHQMVVAYSCDEGIPYSSAVLSEP
jgi:hypothetical protein